MPSETQFQPLQLVRKCKGLQIDASAYRALLHSALAQTKLTDFQIQNELDKLRLSLQPSIEEEYRALEEAILDERDALPALKRLLNT